MVGWPGASRLLVRDEDGFAYWRASSGGDTSGPAPDLRIFGKIPGLSRSIFTRHETFLGAIAPTRMRRSRYKRAFHGNIHAHFPATRAFFTHIEVWYPSLSTLCKIWRKFRP